MGWRVKYVYGVGGCHVYFRCKMGSLYIFVSLFGRQMMLGIEVDGKERGLGGGVSSAVKRWHRCEMAILWYL